MGFDSQYFKHRASIRERWLPIKVKVMLEEDPEKKISIIRKAQKQAAKEIHDIEVKSTFITFLEMEIDRWKYTLSQNGSAKAQEPVQSNETLNTGESKVHSTGEPVEKINWQGTETQLVFLMELLTQEGFLKSSRQWKMVEEHFLVKGKLLKPKQLSQTYQNLPVKGPRKAQILESILSQVSSLED